MDGESGMWLMEVLWWVMSLHVRDTFDRGSAVSCCQQLTRGECSLTGPAWPAAFPKQLHSSYFHSAKKFSRLRQNRAFPDPPIKVGLEQMCRRVLSMVAQIER